MRPLSITFAVISAKSAFGRRAYKISRIALPRAIRAGYLFDFQKLTFDV